MTEHQELIKTYGQSKQQNFKVINDDIVTPHLYMITQKHLEYNDSIYLGEPQIKKMEQKHGSLCGYHCGKRFEEHEKALTVQCKLPMTKDGKTFNKELHEYLVKIKPLAEQNGFKGFAFVDAKGKGAKV